jgi:hypothetical protein
MTKAASPQSPDPLTATPEERDALRAFGSDAEAARELSLSRSTVARAAAGYRMREGSIALLRERLKAHAAKGGDQ